MGRTKILKQKNIGKWLSSIALMFFFLCCPTLANADPFHPTLLEVGVQESMLPFEHDQNRTVYVNELALSLGLGWMPIAYLTLHANLGISWAYALNEPFSYAFHNHQRDESSLFSLDAAVLLEVHLPSRLPSIYGELAAKSYFAPRRAGIFRVLAGTGLMVSPFFENDNTLRTVQFGAGVRFPLIDDFESVFALKHNTTEYHIRIVLGF